MKDNKNSIAPTRSNSLILIIAILLFVCAVYWIIQAIAYDNVNIIMLFISIGIPLLLLFLRKRY